MNLLFIFRRFNDLDHIAPLANLISQNFNLKIYILSINDNIDIFKIPLIQRLKRNKNIICGYTNEFNQNIYINFLFKILNKKKINLINKLSIGIKYFLKKNYISKERTNEWLDNLKIDTLFLDFPYNEKNDQLNLIINSCNKKNIPILGFHHAVWTRVLRHKGKVDPMMNEMFDKLKILSKKYNKIMVGNKDFENNLQVIDNCEKKFISLGSLRFTKKWQDELFNVYNIKKNLGFRSKNKNLKILYIDHSYKHGLVGNKIFDSLKKILIMKDVNLKIKPNTGSDFKNEYALSSNKLLTLKEYFSNESTLSLINDSDVVINTFSSAAVDAHLLKKCLIIPKFFFSTYTQYQKYEACIEIENETELLNCIKSLRDEQIFKMYDETKVQKFMHNVIYNNTSENLMYERYKDFIKQKLFN